MTFFQVLSESPGVGRILSERGRQIEKEGYTAEHDDAHNEGELALAACAYAAPLRLYVGTPSSTGFTFEDPFPWHSCDDKRYDCGETPEDGTDLPDPESYSGDERIDLLTKAGALIAAEIDRLIRAAKAAESMQEVQG